jgi:hypothetical protein
MSWRLWGETSESQVVTFTPAAMAFFSGSFKASESTEEMARALTPSLTA